MASWKVKGYVSDSDEDEHSVDIVNYRRIKVQQKAKCQQTEASASTHDAVNYKDGSALQRTPVAPLNDHEGQHHGITAKGLTPGHPEQPNADFSDTVQRLEKSLTDGLAFVREALSRSPSALNLLEIDDDSPLSSPPESPALSPVPEPLPAEPAPQFPEQIITTHAPQRSFRQRSAIQQHPYSLEYAQYLKRCAERGIKPVNLPRAASPNQSRRHIESQDSQFNTDGQEEDSLGRDSEDVEFEADLRDPRERGGSSNDDSAMLDSFGDDLPDLEDLLQKTTKVSSHRKVPSAIVDGATRSVRHQRTYDMSSDDELYSVPTSRAPKLMPNAQQQDSFPSPPLSNSVDTILPPSLSGSSQSRSPVAPPTPMVSSAIRPRKRPVIEDDSQSGCESVAAPSVSTSSESQASESETDDSAAIRVLQKRVRGVLPASWLSIDRVQKEMNARKKNVRPRDLQRHEAGVAQIRSTARPGNGPGTRNNLDPFSGLISDEDEDASEVDKWRKSPSQGIQPPQPTGPDSDIDVEAIEVNDAEGLDPMLPTRSIVRREGKKKQTHLNGFVRKKRHLHNHLAVTASRHARRFTKSPMMKRKKTNHSNQDSVHVLDAPDLRSTPEKPRPSFLRVAARQARKRDTRFGTSASNKFFQLSDDDETAGILADFKARRENTQSLPQSLQRLHPARPPVQQYCPKQSSHQAQRLEMDNGTLDMNLGAATSNGHHTTRNEKAVQHEIGHVVECGIRSEAHKLRLTRLRSILPLMNRSGLGQFEFPNNQARAAQVEALQRPYKKLVPRRSASRFYQSATATELQQLSTTVLYAHSPVTADGVQEPSHQRRHPRKRKRTPVQRPQGHQTMLVPPNPDSSPLQLLIGQSGPHVREKLEREFVEHQAAWFQGSKSGITASNQNTQHHFRVFLDVLKAYLPTALQDADDVSSSREMRSFMHRLIPNRGQIGAQGQVGNKRFEVHQYDVLVACNVFELHTWLLNLAPGCAPKPRVLAPKVNFADAHHEICLIALSAWESICDFHHNDVSIVNDLAGWIYSMLSQLISRWKAAEIDARNEAVSSKQRIDEHLIRVVIDHNRKQTCEIFAKVLSTLRQSIKDAASQAEADTLFDVPRLQGVLDGLCHLHELSDSILESALQIPKAYVDQQWHLRQPDIVPTLLSSIRQAITTLTSVREQMLPSICSTTAQVYFAVARAAVLLHQRSWDEFFEPRSTHCPDMFIAATHLENFKSWFYARLIEQETSQYSLEFRVPVLAHWLKSLLRTQADASACASLTNALFIYEKDSLNMPDLAATFNAPDLPFSEQQTQRCLPEIRHTAVLHVIAHLQGQADNAEAEWLPGGLEPNDAVMLLRLIFTTMKDTWLALREQPEDQDVYTVLLHAALDQSEAYPRADYTPDPWFFNSAVFPKRRKHSLSRLLSNRVTTIPDALNDALETFEHELDHAKRFERLENLEAELMAIFINDQINQASLQIHNRETTSLQARFIEVAFSRLLDKSGDEWTAIRTMTLRVLVHLLKILECRSDTLTQKDVSPLVQASTTILSLLQFSVAWETNTNRQLIYAVTRLTFEWTIAISEALPERFLDEIESICKNAGQEETEEAFSLLRSVMQHI